MQSDVAPDASRIWNGSASARVGLLGNPSDGYGGRVLAMTVPTLGAHAELHPARTWNRAPATGTRALAADVTVLLDATVQLLRDRRPELVTDPGHFSLHTTIPRQVGLAGSSAIIMAALRALAARAGYVWDLVELARLTLQVETDMLGWTAGPQDRVVQAYQGLVDMDFTEPWNARDYHRLDPAQLPPLFVAWDTSTGTSSDVVHADVRQRWLAGDSVVRAAMERFADLAARGRAALDAGSAAHDWPDLLDTAFELRSRFWHITDMDQALIETGRSVGAGVAFAGSGGAVVGALGDPANLPNARVAYERLGAGFHVLAPT